MTPMTLYAAHRKRLLALRLMAKYERRAWRTRRRRTPAEERINSETRFAWAAVYFTLQDLARKF